MRYSGRIIVGIGALFIHSIYIIYYYFRDGKVEPFDQYSSPIVFLLGFWVGLQFDKARFLSERDLLTGMYNRRFVTKAFKQLASLVDCTNSQLFVLIIDCDNFKSINDCYGHNRGDQVLKKIGETLIETTRKSDIVGRWGGDEFLIIGHYKDTTGLQTMLQRLDENLSILSDQFNIPIMVSIGSAVYPNQSKKLDDLIKIADTNMYKQKEMNKKTTS